MHAYENIDKLLLVEMRPDGLPMGIIPQLYKAARAEQPICYEIANAVNGLAPGSRIACVTGIALPFLPKGEIDGPIGAAVLAQALIQLGFKADVLVETPIVSVVEAVRARMNGEFPIVNTSTLTQAQATGLVADYDAAFTVEKLGRNAAGIRHSIMGTPCAPEEPALDDFIAAMNAAGKLTVGYGDGGNEMGFGALYEQTKQIVPRGADCGCPCGKGITTTTATRLLHPVNVSNFGAYGTVAALSILNNRQDLLPDGDTIVGLISVAVAEGCLEGGSAKPGAIGDDGIPGPGVVAWVNVLKTIISQSFVKFDRHF